jgi:cell wall-associated NlpC family hydrolase
LAFESSGANSPVAASPAPVAASAVPVAGSPAPVAASAVPVAASPPPVAAAPQAVAGTPAAAASAGNVGYPAGTYPAASPAGGVAGADQLAGAGGSLGSLDPASAAKLEAMVHQANALVGLPYVWGGGHAGWEPQAGYDCSGFVSKVLHAGGLLSQPVTTDNLVGQPGIASGPGSHVTIYDRAHPVTGQSEGHVIICINGQFYESGGQHGAWGGGGGVEKIGRPSASYLATFTNVLHPEGL